MSRQSLSQSLESLFDHILSNYGHRVMAIIESRSECPSDNKDIYQQVSLKLWTYLQVHRRSPDPVAAWLLKVTKTTIADCMRSNIARKRREQEFADRDLIQRSEAVTPQFAEVCEILKQARLHLDEVSAEILRRRMEHQSRGFIALEMGLTPANVLTREKKTLELLKKWVTKALSLQKRSF